MKIHNIEGMSDARLRKEIQEGGKFIVYQYVISILIMTFKRPTGVYFIKKGENRFIPGIVPSLVTLVFGWWGIPWGPIYSIGALGTNLMGGRDLTKEIMASTSHEEVSEEAVQEMVQAQEKEARFCASCGKETSSDWKFCKHCGDSLQAS